MNSWGRQAGTWRRQRAEQSRNVQVGAEEASPSGRWRYVTDQANTNKQLIALLSLVFETGVAGLHV